MKALLIGLPPGVLMSVALIGLPWPTGGLVAFVLLLAAFACYAKFENFD